MAGWKPGPTTPVGHAAGRRTRLARLTGSLFVAGPCFPKVSDVDVFGRVGYSLDSGIEGR